MHQNTNTNTNKYKYNESAWYSLLDITSIALDFCFLPYVLQLTWNQSFTKIHDSINEIDWKTAFMLRASIWFLGAVFTKITSLLEYQRRFYHFANMLYQHRLPYSYPSPSFEPPI